jgi:hypothetical protein
MDWHLVANQIRGRERQHLDVLRTVLRTDGGRIFPADLIVAGAIQRSLMLMKGFLAMLRSGNYLCGGGLLRMQIDNILRLYAAALFPSGSDTLTAFLEGRPLSRLKAPDGKALTDRELVRRVGAIYPWVPRVYERASGFVHFSIPAMMSPVTDLADDGQLEMLFGFRGGRPWKREERLEAAQAFDAATEAVLDLVYAWGYSKALIAARRTVNR